MRTDGKQQKRFIPTGRHNSIHVLEKENNSMRKTELIFTVNFPPLHSDLKSTKERTKELVKTNWLEVLATIAEVMGAYDRSKESKDTGYKVIEIVTREHKYSYDAFMDSFFFFFL